MIIILMKLYLEDDYHPNEFIFRGWIVGITLGKMITIIHPNRFLILKMTIPITPPQQFSSEKRQKSDIAQPLHYGEVGTFACRSNHKVVNFGKLFLCQFSSNTWKIWHEACLTPQKSGNEKFKKCKHARRGKKQKTRRGCFSQTKRVSKNSFWWMLWYLLCEHLWKTPPNRKKLHPKSEKKDSANISALFWMLQGGQISDLSVHFHFLWVVLVFKMKDVHLLWNKTEHDWQLFISSLTNVSGIFEHG